MIYRWERDTETYDRDGCMMLRPDDDRPQDYVYVAFYWRDPAAHEWDWMVPDTGREGECERADDARRACELAVLHQEETT